MITRLGSMILLLLIYIMFGVHCGQQVVSCSTRGVPGIFLSLVARHLLRCGIDWKGGGGGDSATEQNNNNSPLQAAAGRSRALLITMRIRMCSHRAIPSSAKSSAKPTKSRYECQIVYNPCL